MIDYDVLCDGTDDWDKKHILGKGGFATVYKGVWKNTQVAIKRIENRDDNTAQNVAESIQELRNLNSYRHDNILAVYGFSINGMSIEYYFIGGQ